MSRTMRLLNYCTKTDHSLPSAPWANLEEMHPNGCAQKNSSCSAEDLHHYKGPTLMICLCSLNKDSVLDTTAADPSRIFSKCFTTKELGCLEGEFPFILRRSQFPWSGFTSQHFAGTDGEAQ